MSKPVIGVTCGDRLFWQTDYYEGDRGSYSMEAVTSALQKAGAIPVTIPIHEPELSKEYIDKIDGLAMTGGADISPQFYNEDPQPKIQRTDPNRDRREIELLKGALEKGIPIFGICRGMQLINIVLGGNMYQDLDYHPNITVQHNQLANASIPVHKISVKPETHYSTLIPDKTMINSYHHQVIKELADGLEAVAWSDDGIIEAYEAINDEFNIVAVQYHPENLWRDDPTHLSLFNDFVDRVNASRDQAY